MKEYHSNQVLDEAANKTKTVNLAESKTEIKQEAYITKLPKQLARIIFLARCDMLKIKAHTKYLWGENMSCRLCGEVDETLDHLTTTCSQTAEIRNQHGNPPTNERFNNKIDELKNYGVMINKILEILQYDQADGTDI